MKWASDIGLLLHASSDVTALGLNLRACRYFNAKNRITFDIGFGADLSSKDVGRFSYRINGGPLQHDGKYELKHNIFPLLLGYEYEWKLKSEKLRLRVGPVCGIAFINGSVTHNPTVDNVPNTFRSESKSALLAGANFGARWNFIHVDKEGIKGMYVDFFIAALGSSTAKFEKLKSSEFNRNANTDVSLAGTRYVVAIGFLY